MQRGDSAASRQLDMDRIVRLVTVQGIWAYVEQTGGGCATIYAGARYTNRFGDPAFAAVAGPGTFGWGQRPSIASPEEFFIGADDQGETPVIDCAAIGARNEQAIADLIVAQAHLPLGAALSSAAAERILSQHATPLVIVAEVLHTQPRPGQVG
jgi:hypothetical protein